jgi:CheY-specific phosphatase CheX
MTGVAAEPLVLENGDCFFDAVSETLASACGIQAQDQPNPDQALEPDANSIVAVIALMGDVEWSLTLGLPAPTATALAQKFTGFAVPFDSGDMGDAIGELANVIAGTTKSKLDQRGTRANISLPTVLRGNVLETVNLRDMPTMRRQVQTSCGALWLALVDGNRIVAARLPGT